MQIYVYTVFLFYTEKTVHFVKTQNANTNTFWVFNTNTFWVFDKNTQKVS